MLATHIFDDPSSFVAIPIAPELPSPWEAKNLAQSTQAMAVTAHADASLAAVSIMKEGGSAVDAAIAAQLVLSLVEPQSSGLGGGAYALVYDPVRSCCTSYDARETASSACHINLLQGADGQVRPLQRLAKDAACVGVPGVPKLLELLHAKHGLLPWHRLFEPAQKLASEGFLVSRRLALHADSELRYLKQPKARAYLTGKQGEPISEGQLLRNPEYFYTLTQLAQHGSAYCYQGSLTQDIIKQIARCASQPIGLTLSDFTNYKVLSPAATECSYRGYRVMGMAGSSAGGPVLAEILGLLEPYDLSEMPCWQADAIELVGLASKLAFADRDHYLADPASHSFSAQELYCSAYLNQRRQDLDYLLRTPILNAQVASPGCKFGVPYKKQTSHQSLEIPSTTHLSIVDGQGLAISLTSSIGFAFGSGLMCGGYFLNDQLIAFTPSSAQQPHANAPNSGKRPLSSMSPTFVFDTKERLHLITGSPGSTAIIGYTLKAILAALDWQLDPQQACNLPNFVHRNRGMEVESLASTTSIAQTLTQRGHDVHVHALTSGIHSIMRAPAQESVGWWGGSDPRRDGLALGY
jgi:gamma-glutamyltranspeptidase / glutathione hydrolase